MTDELGVREIQLRHYSNRTYFKKCPFYFFLKVSPSKKNRKIFELTSFLTTEPRLITIELSILSSPYIEIEVKWLWVLPSLRKNHVIPSDALTVFRCFVCFLYVDVAIAVPKHGTLRIKHQHPHAVWLYRYIERAYGCLFCWGNSSVACNKFIQCKHKTVVIFHYLRTQLLAFQEQRIRTSHIHERENFVSTLSGNELQF